MRVVSLLPAGTEIVAALGAVNELVGVTHECDWPPGVRSRERVTTTGIDTQAAAGDIDAAVQHFVESGTAIFALLEDRIARQRPDVIVTQALCDVCAVSETDVRALAARLPSPPRIVTLGASTLDGVLDDIVHVAGALGRDAEGAALVASLRDRMRRVHETLKAAAAPRPRVAVIEWTDPVYAAGHWVPEMVRRAGGIDVLATAGEHSRPRAPGLIAAAAPDILLVSPCGHGPARAADEGRRLLALGDWAWARERETWAIDANGLVSRPGPRLVDGIEVMAAIFHPSLFPTPSAAQAIRIPASAYRTHGAPATM